MAGIMNLTQHAASPEQQAAGVIDLPDAARDLLVRLLTFEDLPKAADIEVRAEAIARLATDLWREWEAGRAPAQTHLSRCVMIGGAPYLMSALERALALQGFKAIYAFSRRESADEVLPDGSVRKISVFRHAGFVEVA
jgi:hypothetical protein